jgi:hypothetical protein
MNPFDIMRADKGGSGSLMPIVIFAIWVVISIISGSQAKKKKQMRRQQEELRNRSVPETHETDFERPRHETTSTPPPPEAQKATDVMGDIRRELETIFTNQRSREEPPVSEKEAYFFDPEKVEHQTYEDRATPVTVPAATVRANADTGKKIFPAFGPIVGENLPEEERVTVDISFVSLDEARRGFVWSEIFAPPKALRE